MIARVLAILSMLAALGVQAQNYQGLWWKSPGGSEAGWGLNIAHQGDVLFVTWHTYEADGHALWLTMSDARPSSAGVYAGTLYQTKGLATNTGYWDDPPWAVTKPVGSGILAFTSADRGTFTFTLNGVTRSKAIERYAASAPAPTCTAGIPTGETPNYQDLWWRSPAGSEPGWGVGIAHDGDLLFATWFGFDPNLDREQWLVMSNGVRTATGSYAGTLYRTTGPPFDADPWDPAQVKASAAGTATFTFTDAANGIFDYTIGPFHQTQPITRFVFSSPPTVCR